MYSLHFLRKWKHLFIFMLTLKRFLELNRDLGDNETWSKEAKCFNPSQLVVVVRSAPSRWEAQRSKSALLLLTPVGDILHWPLVLPSFLVCDDATVQAEWQVAQLWASCRVFDCKICLGKTQQCPSWFSFVESWFGQTRQSSALFWGESCQSQHEARVLNRWDTRDCAPFENVFRSNVFPECNLISNWCRRL